MVCALAVQCSLRIYATVRLGTVSTQLLRLWHSLHGGPFAITHSEISRVRRKAKLSALTLVPLHRGSQLLQ